MWSSLRRVRPASLLLPLFLTSAPTQTGSVRVIVRSGDGETGVPAIAVNVLVEGTTLGAITNESGIAVLRSVPSGRRVITIRRIGFCPTKRAVDVHQGVETVVRFWLCADAIEAQNAPTEELIAFADLRVSAAGPEPCEEDRRRIGTEIVNLGLNALPLSGTPTCHGAVAILTTKRALYYTNDPASLPWTSGFGDVHVAVLPDRRLQVPVTVYIADETLTAPAKTALIDKIKTVHLLQVEDLLRENRTGVELVASEALGGTPTIVDVAAVFGTPFDAIGDGCAHATSIRATAAIYDAGRINVYYVPSVNGGASAGYACVAEDAPNILFIDHDGSTPFTLAHEIGHALGLNRPAWGHPDGMRGFVYESGGNRLNVMSEYTTAPTYFSLGQALQINLEQASWLNANSAGDGTSLRTRQTPGIPATVTAACGCPESESVPDCPALMSDLPREGIMQDAPDFPTGLMACSVTVPTTVTVACGATAKVDAEFYWKGTTRGVGGGKWVSLDPAVASATVDGTAIWPANDGTTGLITGQSVGTATVRAYGGGSFAPVQVTVTGPCS